MLEYLGQIGHTLAEKHLEHVTHVTIVDRWRTVQKDLEICTGDVRRGVRNETLL